MCFRCGEFVTGTGDRLLAQIGQCPFYVDARLYRAWGEPVLTLDVEPGFPEGFSLTAGDGMHFVVRGQPSLTELGLSTGKKARLRRILFRRGLANGTALFLPYD
jgi:uncharacterized protein (DUF779 family)